MIFRHSYKIFDESKKISDEQSSQERLAFDDVVEFIK